MASGYTNCACRDCFDVSISSDTSKPELCGECKSAECERPTPNVEGFTYTYECQREDSYSECLCGVDGTDELDCPEHGRI